MFGHRPIIFFSKKMSEFRVSDPCMLHLKKELTQIRKAGRVLRDPGTSSSWKSPLNSSRSVAAALAASTSVSARKGLENESRRKNGNAHLDSQLPNTSRKEKRVFLYNWKNQKSFSEKSAVSKNDDDDGDDESSSAPEESLDDALSDAPNDGESRRDANPGKLINPLSKREAGIKKKSKKNYSHLNNLSRYQQKQIPARNSRSFLEDHPSMALGLGQDDSIEQSDDTEDYCNSEDLRKLTGASPLLLKLKNKNCSQSSTKLLRSSRRDDSSYTQSTPALSTSSYNRFRNRNPSTLGSWDGNSTSMNDGDDEVDDHLDFPGRQGCGIPCYWSKRTPRHRGVCGSCYSPSLSDTIRRKGSSILCGSQTMYHKRHRSLSGSNKMRIATRSSQGFLPLLSNSGDGRGGSSIGTGHSDDELSTNFGELDLEALSRLDGRRWSTSCRSQEGSEIVARNGEKEEEGMPETTTSLSQKYKPMFFDELIGQNVVVQPLMSAVSRGRIAPVYLFQGPRGTGKTSAARIFAAALNCLATDESKPCGHCKECTGFISGKSRDLWEVDGTNKRGIDKVRYLLKNLSAKPPPALSRYRIFIIDECHLLSSTTWLAFLKFLEEPPPRVLFIFITTDLDNVPRTIQSRCQRYLFNKIKDNDIVARLRKISAAENMDAESDALDLIALNADGSLRDAETMLDQLSLLGKKITTYLVNELVGVVSEEKLLELLELAMSSDTAETVKRARELMDSGVDPMVLMSRLASLIMDIIAGTYNIVDAKCSDSSFGGRSLTEEELERLKNALKLLSGAEKQLRVSSERSTWFTATLLQLGSVPSPDFIQSSSRRQSPKITEDDLSSASREATNNKQKSDAQYHYVPRKSTSPASLYNTINGYSSHRGDLSSRIDGFSNESKPLYSQFMDGGASVASHDDIMIRNMIFSCMKSDKLDGIWAQCIERCHSKTLRLLLQTHGKLVSVSEVEGVLVAYVAFGDRDIKSRAERFLSSITNSIEVILRRNVEVRIILFPDGEASISSANQVELPGLKQTESTVSSERRKKAFCTNAIDSYSDPNLHQEQLISRGTLQSTSGSSEFSAEGDVEVIGRKERGQGIPMQRIESIIREQRLETAWLQAADKGTPKSSRRLKPEKNQVLPQDGIYHQNQVECITESSKDGEDELQDEPRILKINSEKAHQKDQIGRRVDHYAMSPSLLHDSSLISSINKDNLGYESGSGTGGCSRLFCWKNTKPHERGKVQGTLVRSKKGRHFSLFGRCGKAKRRENRFRR